MKPPIKNITNKITPIYRRRHKSSKKGRNFSTFSLKYSKSHYQLGVLVGVDSGVGVGVISGVGSGVAEDDAVVGAGLMVIIGVGVGSGVIMITLLEASTAESEIKGLIKS